MLLITGPRGCGKSTLAQRLRPGNALTSEQGKPQGLAHCAQASGRTLPGARVGASLVASPTACQETAIACALVVFQDVSGASLLVG